MLTNKKTVTFSLLLLLCTQLIQTYQYVYPVASIDDSSLLLMHQKSLYEVDLLQWDIETKDARKVLWSIYMPSSVSLLPEKNGFSFIDQGRIRIKYFNKRSPQTVNIYETVTTFDSVVWIDNETFYFTAEDPHFHNVFCCELNKNIASISRLTFEVETDFLYPQKVDGELFCIKRDQEGEFSVVKLPWKERAFENYKETKGESLVESDKHCCFLHMESAQKGYFISYSPCKNRENNTYTFWCNELQQDYNGNWSYKEIFSFNIQEEYITGRSGFRMYESVKPLLPRYEKCGIFFSHFDSYKKQFILKKYNRTTEQVEFVPALHKKSTPLFAPVFCKGEMYCGMMLKGARSFLDDHCNDGDFQFDLHKFSPEE